MIDMQKVIFLDIDGVMNSELFYRARHKKRWLDINTYYWWIKSKVKYVLNGFKYKPVSLVGYVIPEKHKTFKYKFNRLKEETDPLLWKWLVELTEETNSKICISSCWKHHFGYKNDEWWKKAFTSLGFKDDVFVGITGDRRTLRGTEIKEWIDSHNVEDYVIIDDDSDMLPDQMLHFFKTDNYVGLTPTILYKIKNYLTKK